MPENENVAAAEFNAETAMDNLLAEASSEEVQQEQTEEQSPEDARKAALSEGLNTLFEDGWTPEELMEFSQDAGVREDIQKNGKTVRQAARAYERRMREAAKQTETQSAKRGVPTVRTASTSGANEPNKYEEMSDKEFEAFYKQAMSDSLAGKKRRF